MCRCGVSCDLIYRKLEQAEKEGRGYNLSVNLLFTEEETGDTQEEDIPESLA